MTKSFSSTGQIAGREIKDKLDKLMEGSKVSLFKASIILGIPFKDAKQVFFTYGTNRSIARALSNSARISPTVKKVQRLQPEAPSTEIK